MRRRDSFFVWIGLLWFFSVLFVAPLSFYLVGDSAEFPLFFSFS